MEHEHLSSRHGTRQVGMPFGHSHPSRIGTNDLEVKSIISCKLSTLFRVTLLTTATHHQQVHQCIQVLGVTAITITKAGDFRRGHGEDSETNYDGIEMQSHSPYLCRDSL